MYTPKSRRERLLGKLAPADRRYARMAAMAANTVAQLGFYPGDNDPNPTHRAVARWLHTQADLAVDGLLSPEHTAALARHRITPATLIELYPSGEDRAFVPSGRARSTGSDVEAAPVLSDVFIRRMNAVHEFHQQHGRYPRADAIAAGEKMLGSWLAEQRNQIRRNRMSEHQLQVLNRQLPEWQYLTDPDTGEQNRSQRVGQFLMDQWRMPSKSSNVDEERRLARWLRSQRDRRKRGFLHPRVDVMLGFYAPGWFDRTGMRLGPETYRRFCFENHRAPSVIAEDPQESLLARWMAFQRDRADSGQMPAEQAFALRTCLGSDWAHDAELVENVARVRSFVDTHQMIPTASLPPGPGRTLGAWLAHTADSYVSGRMCMADEQILRQALPDLPPFTTDSKKATEELTIRRDAAA